MQTQNNRDRKMMREKAGAAFGNGFHCAEAVVAAFLEYMGEDPRLATAHATPFGGGIGRSFEDVCGALTGGLIAIGHFSGRSQPGPNWDLPADLADQLRHRFLERQHTTNCGVLRQRFGERQMDECRLLVQHIVDDLVDILDHRGEKAREATNACCTD